MSRMTLDFLLVPCANSSERLTTSQLVSLAIGVESHFVVAVVVELK